MKKLLTIASREFRAAIATKAFLVTIVLMPVMMFGGIVAMRLFNRVSPIKEQRIVVVDRTSRLFDLLKSAADARNDMVKKVRDQADSKTEVGKPDENPFGQAKIFLLERFDQEQFGNDERLELSDRIRNQEVYAFVEFPTDLFNSESTSNATFCAEETAISDARRWLQRTVQEVVKQDRFQTSGVAAEIVAKANQPVPLNGIGLYQSNESGQVQETKSKDVLSAMFVPMGFMMLMFMVIFLAAQPAMESVLEEKSQRIAEVLLGSVSPFQLMAGKLVGTVAGSLTICSIYLVGVLVFAQQKGYWEMIPLHVIPWFIVFQICGVLFYASIFMAIGAAVTQLKEAQSMLLPVWLLMMFPLFIWFNLVQDPNGSIATWLSLFPPATPSLMTLRLATGAAIPIWQPILGIILTVLATVFCIQLAGKIFRTGLLWQGKTPKITEIVAWAFGK